MTDSGSYVLDAGINGTTCRLSGFIQHKAIALADIIGKGRDRVTLDKVPLPEATRFAAEQADIALRLALVLKPRLVAERRLTVYETLERPLIPVLAAMERTGTMIAPSFLQKLSTICEGHGEAGSGEPQLAASPSISAAQL